MMNPLNEKKKKNSHIISLLVANKPGVLVRIAHVFARRNYNIDSLVVSATVNPLFSRMTITTQGDPETLDQIIKQTGKLIDVIHIGEHAQESVQQELMLTKIKCNATTKTIILKHLKKFNARLVDDTDNVLIIEQTGSSDQLDALESLLKKYGLVEMVRSGKLVMVRGKEPT